MRDPEAAQWRQVAIVDQLGQGARVDDLLEHLVEPLSVAACGGGSEAEQRPVEGGLEHAQLSQDAQVVLGRRVVALVIDDEPHVAAPQDARQPLLVQRADRAHEHLRLSRRPERAALDLDDGVALERAGPASPAPASAAPHDERAPALGVARAWPGARRSRSCRRPSADGPAGDAGPRGAPRARRRSRRVGRDAGRWARGAATRQSYADIGCAGERLPFRSVRPLPRALSSTRRPAAVPVEHRDVPSFAPSGAS